MISKMKNIIIIAIIMLTGLIILLMLNKPNTTLTFNNIKINNIDPIIPSKVNKQYLCNNITSFMSTDIYPDLLLSNGNNCNVLLTITTFDNKINKLNEIVNDNGITNFGKFVDNGILSLKRDKEILFIPAPS